MADVQHGDSQVHAAEKHFSSMAPQAGEKMLNCIYHGPLPKEFNPKEIAKGHVDPIDSKCTFNFHGDIYKEGVGKQPKPEKPLQR